MCSYLINRLWWHLCRMILKARFNQMLIWAKRRTINRLAISRAFLSSSKQPFALSSSCILANSISSSRLTSIFCLDCRIKKSSKSAITDEMREALVGLWTSAKESTSNFPKSNRKLAKTSKICHRVVKKQRTGNEPCPALSGSLKILMIYLARQLHVSPRKTISQPTLTITTWVEAIVEMSTGTAAERKASIRDRNLRESRGSKAEANKAWARTPARTAGKISNLIKLRSASNRHSRSTPVGSIASDTSSNNCSTWSARTNPWIANHSFKDSKGL